MFSTPTDGCRLLITLGVQLCERWSIRHEAKSLGSSASADILRAVVSASLYERSANRAFAYPICLSAHVSSGNVVEFGEAIKNPAYRIPQTEDSGCLDISAHA